MYTVDFKNFLFCKTTYMYCRTAELKSNTVQTSSVVPNTHPCEALWKVQYIMSMGMYNHNLRRKKLLV